MGAYRLPVMGSISNTSITDIKKPRPSLAGFFIGLAELHHTAHATHTAHSAHATHIRHCWCAFIVLHFGDHRFGR